MEIAELAIILTSRIDDLTNKLNTAKQRVTGVQKHTARASTMMRSSWLKVAGTLAAFGLSIFGAIMAIKNMIKTTVAFDKSMKSVESKTQATGAEIKKLTDLAREMGATTIFSATESAEAMSGLAEMGLKTASDMRNVLKPSLDLAAATGISVADSSMQIVKALKGFGFEMTEASRVANVLAAAHVNSTATVHVLREAFKYAAPVAGELGQSIESVAAISAKFSDIGLEASQTGTSYRMAMTKLTKAFNDNGEAATLGGKILERHGFTQEKMTSLLPKPIELMKELGKANLSTGEALHVYGTRAAFAFNRLVEYSDEIGNLRDKITGTNAAQEIAAIQLNSIWGKSKLVKSIWEELSLVIGDKLTPFIKELLDQLVGSVKAFLDNKDATEKLIKSIKGVVTGFVRLYQAGYITVKSIFLVYQTFWGLIKVQAAFIKDSVKLAQNVETKTTPAFKKFGETGMTTMPILISIGKIISFLRTILLKIGLTTEKVRDTFKKSWSAMIESVGASISPFFTVLQLVGKFPEKFKTTKDAAKNMTDTLKKGASDFTEDIKNQNDGINKLLESLKDTGAVNAFVESTVNAAKKIDKLTGDTEKKKVVSAKSQEDALYQLYVKVLELEGRKVEAQEFSLRRELGQLDAVIKDKVLLHKYAAHTLMNINKEMMTDQLKNIQQGEIWENESTKERIATLKGLLDYYKGSSLQQDLLHETSAEKRKIIQEKLTEFYRDNAGARAVIEEDLQKHIQEKNKETLDIVTKYTKDILGGPLEDAMTSYFKHFQDGTINMGEVWKKLWTDIVATVISSVAKLVVSGVLNVLAMALTGGGSGFIGKLLGFEKGGIVRSFASGGIVNGPGVAMVGDVPNMSPEVIAPLDKLQEMLMPKDSDSGIKSTNTLMQSDPDSSKNVTINYNVAFSNASPSEARKFGQEVLRLLQTQGLRPNIA